ncbi:Gfo/Idh/MocA family oxidoreductase [Actomonas aquatica]|uniref:Gfo/Idh/MocA family oxidoreductase n=1 Tax=Actomonas aquatica TaxID=2866162 RepID=A0ABZ1C3P8_9BACT|nr:Gfo/Idh/MocA family oxidoreductase [Opitutus sp. WL0086]WRQ86230.1 Gfo/Idh/MocA family oxidoreductase [Opitutus sp. WL0086]
MPRPTRRDFLRSGALASSLLWAGCQTRSGSGTTNATKAAATSANATSDRVRLALVGIGNRGQALIQAFNDTGLTTFVTAADVDLGGAHCVEPRQMLGDIPYYADFREMLAEQERNIDAVVIATPDFSHCPIAMLAMAAGKHVFVEKPLAQSFDEVDLLIEQAQRTGVVTQMGNQGHSGPNYFQFKAWSEAGIIKDITRIDAFMNSPRRWHGWTVDGFDHGRPTPDTIDWDLWHVGRPMHDFSERLHPGNWRSWFEYGDGAFGDWAPHILDTAHRFLDLGLPDTIEAVKRDGPNDYIFPQASTIRFGFPQRRGHPACDVFWYDGVDNQPALPPEETVGAERARNGKYLYSADGTVFRGGTHSATLRIIPAEKMREMAPRLPRFPQKNSDHFANFALACLGQEQARSPFSVSGPLSQVFILGCIAQRLGGTLKFDRQQRRFVDHPIANALLSAPPPRFGWAACYRV